MYISLSFSHSLSLARARTLSFPLFSPSTLPSCPPPPPLPQVWHIAQQMLDEAAASAPTHEAKELKLSPVASERIGSRLTCMCLADPTKPKRRIRTALTRMEELAKADPAMKEAAEEKAQASFRPAPKNALPPPQSKKAKARRKAKEEEQRFDEVPVESTRPLRSKTEGLFTPADARSEAWTAGEADAGKAAAPGKGAKGKKAKGGEAKRPKIAADADGQKAKKKKKAAKPLAKQAAAE